MKLAFSATNPCHVYELAREVAAQGTDAVFYSGYPRWRLDTPGPLRVEPYSARTVLAYASLKLPLRLRPPVPALFKWQDRGFDRGIARRLERADYLHGIPGQCLATFEAARKLGITTVLNHASGPIRQQLQLIEPEYRRAGRDVRAAFGVDEESLARTRDEYALADLHCVASSVVRDQLIAEGIASEKIWVVPYGADPSLFVKELRPPSGGFKICVAASLSLRKGVFYLLRALERLERRDWSVDCYGLRQLETEPEFAAYRGATVVQRHGAVSRAALAQKFRESSVLVLPSAEEAFGLVVVQALQSGLPCIVSDRVGAKDLIRHRVNGSIVPFGDVERLMEELLFWEQSRARVAETYDWSGPARELVSLSAGAARSARSA